MFIIADLVTLKQYFRSSVYFSMNGPYKLCYFVLWAKGYLLLNYCILSPPPPPPQKNAHTHTKKQNQTNTHKHIYMYNLFFVNILMQSQNQQHAICGCFDGCILIIL